LTIISIGSAKVDAAEGGTRLGSSSLCLLGPFFPASADKKMPLCRQKYTAGLEPKEVCVCRYRPAS
jgi:hypothetical protein